MAGRSRAVVLPGADDIPHQRQGHKHDSDEKELEKKGRVEGRDDHRVPRLEISAHTRHNAPMPPLAPCFGLSPRTHLCRIRTWPPWRGSGPGCPLSAMQRGSVVVVGGNHQALLPSVSLAAREERNVRPIGHRRTREGDEDASMTLHPISFFICPAAQRSRAAASSGAERGAHRSIIVPWMSDYDVIVIGAGHNGLTAAAVMARGGLRVLCLEKNHFIGGMGSTTELARGYRFE